MLSICLAADCLVGIENKSQMAEINLGKRSSEAGPGPVESTNFGGPTAMGPLRGKAQEPSTNSDAENGPMSRHVAERVGVPSLFRVVGSLAMQTAKYPGKRLEARKQDEHLSKPIRKKASQVSNGLSHHPSASVSSM